LGQDSHQVSVEKGSNLSSIEKIITGLFYSNFMGSVKTVGDGVVKAVGLHKVAYGAAVYFPESRLTGFACNLNRDSVDILVFGDDRLIKSGNLVFGTRSGVRVPVSKQLLGRIINPLGNTIDGGLEITNIKYTADVNAKAPGIIFRKRIHEPLFTGIKVIDSLIPIGRGQRELIIGDKGTGKTSICFDTILNQKLENTKDLENPVVCVYVVIGQKKSNVRSFHDMLKRFGADSHTVIVSATSSEPAAFQYLAPYSGCAIAEFFMSFAHSLIIYDDLSQHAVAYRQISLLLRRPPGREAYPGDVFYLHSRLLERAAKLADRYGGSSMTALPIIETLFGDITAYIPTNVISITDGQIFLDRNLFTEGIIPAVNIGLSVSRVGSAAQLLSMKKVAGSLKLELAQYREVKDFTKFGSDLSDETVFLINRGKLLTELLKQKRYVPVSPEEQVLTLYAGLNGYLDKINIKNIFNFMDKLLAYTVSTILFRTHFELLRFDEYYAEFGGTGLKTLLDYFGKFKVKIS
jgi:F-type H+-transporting ATPase subunit alpha